MDSSSSESSYEEVVEESPPPPRAAGATRATAKAAAPAGTHSRKPDEIGRSSSESITPAPRPKPGPSPKRSSGRHHAWKPSRDQDGTRDTAWPNPRACFQEALLEQFKPRRCWRQVREGRQERGAKFPTLPNVLGQSQHS